MSLETKGTIKYDPDVKPGDAEYTIECKPLGICSGASGDLDSMIGMHVKQVRPYLNRTVSGIGAVTALVKGLVEVNFNGSQYYKIAPDCLEVL